MQHLKFRNPGITAVLAALCISGAAYANDVQLDSSGLFIASAASAGEISLSVSGPEGYQYRSPANSNRSSYGLADMNISQDGMYRYEVQQISYSGEQKASDPANGRESATRKIVTNVQTSSGIFRVKNGSIVMYDTSLTEDAQSAGAK